LFSKTAKGFGRGVYRSGKGGGEKLKYQKQKFLRRWRKKMLAFTLPKNDFLMEFGAFSV